MRSDDHGNAVRRRATVALAVLLALCGHVAAAEGTVGVSVRVLASAPAVEVLDAFPAPPGSQRMSRTRQADSYLCPLAHGDAVRHVHAAMAERGFRLAYASEDGRTQHWSDARSRIAVQLDPVLGASPATRILVQADTRS